MEQRTKTILKTSIIGIVVNALLAIFKVIVGLIANSISVLMDGVNNFADAGSSLVTLVGAALAGKAPNKKHPFGYGRIEYLSSLLIAGLVLYAGVTSLIESIKGIIHPEEPEYSTVTLVVIGVAVLVKLALALFTQRQGKKAKSDSLVASGKEALLDVAISVSTIVAAIVFITTGFGIEAYLAAVISLLIIKTGIELLIETISKMIGEAGDVQLVNDVKATIREFDGVNGAYDLILNDYGPERYMASVHVEVDDTMTANEMDELTRAISERVYEKYGIAMAAVGIYSHNTQDNELKEMEMDVKNLAMKQEYVKGIHAFYVNETTKKMRFDLVISFETKKRLEAYMSALQAVREAYPEYDIMASMDADFNELTKK